MFRIPGFHKTSLSALPSSAASKIAESARLFSQPSSTAASSASSATTPKMMIFTATARNQKSQQSLVNSFLRKYQAPSVGAGRFSASSTPSVVSCCAFTVSSNRAFFTRNTRVNLEKKNDADSAAAKTPNARNHSLQEANSLKERTAEDEERDKKQEEEEEEEAEGNANGGYLPFPEPFHTINIMMLLLLGNLIVYIIMYAASDSTRDWMVDNFTLSHENYHLVYPWLTHAFYQENLLQLAIDSWLLWQFGRTQLGFLGNTRLTFFWALCTIGGGFIHVVRQKVMLYYDMDPIEVRGRVFGPNPFILGLVGLEGLIFRNMNFLQNPPVPFLVLTAGVMIIDVWRIFTMKPEEHGSSTGGALVAYIMWALPTRFLGLDKLTAAI